MARDFWARAFDHRWVSGFDSFDSRPLEFPDFDRRRGDILEAARSRRAASRRRHGESVGERKAASRWDSAAPKRRFEPANRVRS